MKRGLFLFVLVLFLAGCSTGAGSGIVPTAGTESRVDGPTNQSATMAITPDDLDIPSHQEIREMHAGRLFSMDDFSSLVPGVSTFEDIDNLTPGHPFTPWSVGNVYQYPAADGCYIYIVCTDTIQAIYLDTSADFVGTIEFLNMMDNPSLRPPVSCWK